MVTFENSLNALVADGVISYEDALCPQPLPKELALPRPVAPGYAGQAPMVGNMAQPVAPALVPAGRL